ncbi:MAG: sporulation protein YunB [Lachnospirales bacterium]
MKKNKAFHKKKYKGTLTLYFTTLLITTILTSYIIDKIEKKIEPLIYELARVYSINLLNTLSSEIINDEIISKNYNSTDFYTYKTDEEGYITLFEVNSILINEIATKMNVSLQKELIDSTEKIISIPIGEVFFVEYFSDFGPTYKYGIIPIGYASIDYDTTFVSIGVNQTNFQVYLNIEADMKIVNPLYEKEFTVDKKVVLLDTMISGKVPEGFLIGE